MQFWAIASEDAQLTNTAPSATIPRIRIFADPEVGCWVVVAGLAQRCDPADGRAPGDSWSTALRELHVSVSLAYVRNGTYRERAVLRSGCVLLISLVPACKASQHEIG